MLKRLCVSAAPWQNPFTEVKSDLGRQNRSACTVAYSSLFGSVQFDSETDVRKSELRIVENEPAKFDPNGKFR